MAEVAKTARLHEHTVQRAAEHSKIMWGTRPRKMRGGFATSYIRVHPVVWEHALRLAGGDPARLQVISSTEVLVTNRSMK